MTSTRWCFTLNNYNDDEENYIKELECLYLVYGKEVGDSGTRHLQGFITFKGNKRLSAVKKLIPRAHWEKTKGTSLEAADYCKKDGDVFEKGTPPSPGKRTDLEIYTTRIKEGESVVTVANDLPNCFVKYHRGLREYALICQKPYEHSDVRGFWIYGAPGVGKSRKVRQDYPSLYSKGQNKWFDGYCGEHAILIDDFDRQGVCLSHHLKIWSDRYSCSGETKGGTVNLQHRTFIITSNYSISELFGDDPVLCAALRRRFRVLHMDPLSVMDI